MPQLKTCGISPSCDARVIGTPYAFLLFQQERGAAINNNISKERRRRAMKTNLGRMAVLVVAAVTMAAPAFAGQTQAEREMSKGKEVGKVGFETRALVPDPNDWEYRSAMETGNLPSDAGVLSAGSAPAADVPKVDYGGVVYRIGIDTQ
jgi:hypothetical protein